MRYATALVALTIILAGCTTGSEKERQVAPEEDPGEAVEVEPGVVVGDKRSVVRGVVVNDAGLPVPGARVSVTGTEFFANTPDSGKFQFVNVTPGEHTVRAEKSGFLVAEKAVTLVKANITDVEMVLLPDQKVGAGYSAHLHDYWAGLTEVTVMDQDIPLVPPDDSPYGTYYSNTRPILYGNLGGTNGYWWEFHLPDESPDPAQPAGSPALIYPGTARMEVTPTWDTSDVMTDEVRIEWDPWGADAVWTDPITNGQTVSVDIDPEWTDDGHQVFSLWRFILQIPNHPSQASDYQPFLATGDVHIQIKLFKGEVPLEPEHPRFWGEGPCRLLRDGSEAYMFNIAITTFDRRYGQNAGSVGMDDIVPPGATRVLLDFRWDYARAGDEGDVDDWTLLARMSDQHPFETTWEQLRDLEAVEGSATEQRKVYEILLENEWTDPFYLSRSLWRLYPVVAGLDREEQALMLHDYRVGDYRFYIDATVCNDNV